MNTIKILEKNPRSSKLITDWFFDKMIQSLKGDSIDDEFRNFMREQALDNEKMAVMIDANPRMLFDVFDENDVIIETIVFPDKTFSCKIGQQATTNSWKTRKESEAFAVEAAFDILENKLTPKELNDENE